MIDPFYRPPERVDTSGWNPPRCKYGPQCQRTAVWVITEGRKRTRVCHSCYYWGHLDDIGRLSHNQWSDNQWRRARSG
jgi:hypothetical protein